MNVHICTCVILEFETDKLSYTTAYKGTNHVVRNDYDILNCSCMLQNTHGVGFESSLSYKHRTGIAVRFASGEEMI